jgi:glyoxylase-like metal-dependent hydrolase (beta-lactamase superfamily II)
MNRFHLVFIIIQQSSGTIGIIKINGVETKAGVPLKVNLNLGDNSFNIYVTAQNGASVNYKLTITQKDLSTVYVSELVAPGIWRIRDFGGFIGNEDMYLIEGKDKALLFDTGMGTGDLATYIKTLTKLPIEVAITHGHGDHFRQLDQFRESTVYMSNKDKLPAEIITPKFQWIKEGDVIDIGGGRKFEVIEIPGHSLGSVIFLDSQNKIAVIGDAIGSGSMVYMFSSTASLANYVDVLKKVEEKIKNLDGLTLLTGHHYQEKTPLIETAGKQYFTDMRIVTEKVLNGEIVGKVAYNTRGGMTTELRQAYYGLAGLWYNPNDKGIVKK